MAYKFKNGKLVKKTRRCSISEPFTMTDATGKPVTEADSPIMQVEAVPDWENPEELYLLLDGERVAYRGRDGGMPAWISMRDGFVCRNGIEVPGTDTPQ